MKKIAFDVMGNDNGVKAAIEAVNIFLETNEDFEFILVGEKNEIEKWLKPNAKVTILKAKALVKKENDSKIIRDASSSMFQAINLVKNNQADIVISSGDSSSYLGLATINLKRLPNVKRPAFMVIVPTIIPTKKFFMTDVGANLEVTPTMINQWAKIAAIFSQKILNVKKPLVAIANIGYEKYKGKDFHISSYKTLKKDSQINFYGFIEPRDLLNGIVDVVLCDGYGGNMILKTMEGSMLGLRNVIKESMKLKLRYKIGGLLVKNIFRDIDRKFDYRNTGMAWVIGLNHLVVKCHGGADTNSYLAAFRQIKISLENDLEVALQKGNYES